MSYTKIIEAFFWHVWFLFLSNNQAEIPTHVGVLDDLEAAMDTEGSGGGLPDANSITKKRYLIDTVYMKHPVKDMELSTFLKDGMGKA